VPTIAPGTVLACRDGKVLNKKTEPPKAFTDATLLQAMTGIARFVSDVELRKILKETDGLGTEATRASILEGLFSRQFLERDGKSIRATPIGRGLVKALPSIATYPDMTAHWERNLCDMAAAKYSQEPFMAALEAKLRDMLEAPCRGEIPASLRNLEAPAAKRTVKTKATRRKTAARKTMPQKA